MVSVESGSVGWLVGWGLSPDGARGWVAGREWAGWLGVSRASGVVAHKNWRKR